MTTTNPPTRPQTASELVQEPAVRAALDQAWIDSQADDPIHRHEEGGWIYMETATGQITVQRAQRGARNEIDLSSPLLLSGAIVVGKFHTHPNPSSEGWATGPSADDLYVDALHGVPDLIKAEDGVHFSGPSSRRGRLAGGLGFPP